MQRIRINSLICLSLVLFMILTVNVYARPLSRVDPIEPYEQDSSVTITATANDSASIELLYFVEGRSGQPYYGYSFGVDNEAPWEWKFTFPKGKGVYRFYSEAINDTGSRETEASAGPPMTDAICEYDGYDYILYKYGLTVLLVCVFVIMITILFIHKRRKDTVEQSPPPASPSQ